MTEFYVEFLEQDIRLRYMNKFGRWCIANYSDVCAIGEIAQLLIAPEDRRGYRETSASWPQCGYVVRAVNSRFGHQNWIIEDEQAGTWAGEFTWDEMLGFLAQLILLGTERFHGFRTYEQHVAASYGFLEQPVEALLR